MNVIPRHSGRVLWFHVGRLCVRPSVFLFPDAKLRKYQWIFTKLAVYINIVEICVWIPFGQTFDSVISYLPATRP